MYSDFLLLGILDSRRDYSLQEYIALVFMGIQGNMLYCSDGLLFMRQTHIELLTYFYVFIKHKNFVIPLICPDELSGKARESKC